MSAISGRYTLYSIISEVKSDAEIFDSHQDARLLTFGSRMLRKLNLRVNKAATLTVQIPIKDNNTADLPKDFMDYEIVGFKCGDSLVAYVVDENILPKDLADPKKYHCFDKGTGSSKSIGDYYYFRWGYVQGINHNNFVGERYGESSKPRLPRYKINYDAWRIEFSSGITSDNVILRYRSTGLQDNGEAIVPAVWFDTIRTYIYAEYCKKNKKESLANKKMAQEDFEREFEEAVKSHLMFTFEEALDIIRGSYTYGLKG